jgi:translocation and assembly module TamB
VKPKWKKRLKWLAASSGLLVLAFLVLVWTGQIDRWARRGIIAQVERMTGGRVELGAFRFHWWSLRAELEDFTIHGTEPEGTPPFFHADYLLVDIRVDSLFRRKISLDEVRLHKPEIHVRVAPDGSSNVPQPRPPRPPGKPLHQRIFDLTIRELRLNNGAAHFNNTRVPLAVEGGEFRFALDYRVPEKDGPRYEGDFSWRQMQLAARRYLPFRSDVAVKFLLERNRFEVTEARWKLPQSEFSGGAALSSFTEPEWSFRFGGTLSLLDLRKILRKPNSPGGRVDFSGRGRFAKSELTMDGQYHARGIEMPYQWFHASGIESRGSFRVAKQRLEMPDLTASVLGGRLRGRMELLFEGARFRVESRIEGMNLAALLRAVDNEDFPVETLHWSGTAAVESITTWDHDFKNVASRGLAVWTPEGDIGEGEIPVSARLEYDYAMARRAVSLRTSEIVTPTARLDLDGRLGAHDSALAVHLRAGNLLEWDDFINRLRGADAEPRRISGQAEFRGTVEGDLGRPTFAGHFRGREAAYGSLFWDEVEGDMVYNADGFRLSKTRARRGPSSAVLQLWLQLRDWSFRPECEWSLEARVAREPMDGLQELFGWQYPLRGLLTTELSGRGTRADPELTGPFELADVELYGERFDSARGEFALRSDELRVSRAELRKNGGRITGGFLYHFRDDQMEFDARGVALSVERIQRVQFARLPLGGTLGFELRGRGSLEAPQAEGRIELRELRVGKEVVGSFEGQIRSSGRQVQLALSSTMTHGKLTGDLHLTLRGDYPIQGRLVIDDLDLDALVASALRLELSGHGHVSGRFALSGELRRPETISVEAELSGLLLHYQGIKLENEGPLRITYRHEEVRFEQARIRGTDTDLRLGGMVRFRDDRAVNLQLSGSVNLRLLGGFLPELEARGMAQVNASVEGTLAVPRIVGAVRLQDAAANYGDFPAGLSKLSGYFLFDRNRLLFENVTAEAGGGQLVLSGTTTFGDGPLRYDFTIQARRVRVRYPEGFSWLAGGRLRLSGSTQAGLLAGRVQVERLAMAEGFDLTSLITTSRQGVTAPTITSDYLRSLQFDIEATSTPNAVLQWSAARFESEASLRLRGTVERPIFLGHIHLLSGEMTFRGNRYRLTRGDVNFADPFRFNPLLSVEATTTIRQYEITLNFTGPASQLTLAYRSDPPLPANDIITLLALGRTGEESELRRAGAEPAAEGGASTLLSEAISAQLGGRLERLFGISRFKVDPFLAGTGNEQNASARVTIEQQVTRDLTITYITNVTSTQSQVIQVEYNVNRNASLVFLRDQNGTFGLDVKLKKRFK